MAVGELGNVREFERSFLMYLGASVSNMREGAIIYQILFCVEFVNYTKIHLTMILHTCISFL